MIGIQALTGLNPRQLLEDSYTSEVIWQHQAQVSTELSSADGLLPLQRPLPVSDRVLQALQPLANLYSPTQHSAFSEQSSTQPEAPQTSITATPSPQSRPSGRTLSQFFRIIHPSQLSSKLDAAVPASLKKSPLLIDMGIGFVAALMVGIYYSVRSAAPLLLKSKVPCFYPLKYLF